MATDFSKYGVQNTGGTNAQSGVDFSKYGTPNNNPITTPEQKSFPRKVVDFFTGGTQELGANLGGLITGKQSVKEYGMLVDAHNNTVNTVMDLYAKAKRENNTRAIEHYGKLLTNLRTNAPKQTDSISQIEQTAFEKTPEQWAGMIGNTALEALQGGLLQSGEGVITSELSKAQKIAQASKISGTYGLLSGVAGGMANNENLGGVVTSGLVGGVVGLGVGTGLGLVGLGLENVLTRNSTKKIINRVDNKIRSMFSTFTGDATKIEQDALRTKKALELMTKELPEITVPDTSKPIGSNATKTIKLNNATPNEFISAITEMDRKITGVARGAVEEATKGGYKLSTTNAENVIKNAVESGEIPKATGVRLLQQILSLKNDPVAVFDWVANVNSKYGSKYGKGTIMDNATSRIAHNIADTLRTSLNTITDRVGYAEAYGNNQALKKAIIGIAKKANKGVNFGDLSTDAAVDAAFSVLTGNPVYMTRTIGSSLFRILTNYVTKKRPFGVVESIVKDMKKVGGSSKMPSGELKTGGAIQNAPGIPPKPPVETQTPNVINLPAKNSNKVDYVGDINNKVKNYTNDLLNKIKNDGQDGFAQILKPYEENGGLTTKLLKDLQGRTEVNKSYIEQRIVSGDLNLKQVEKDIARQVLETMPDKVNVQEFADRMKAELLPLERKTSGSSIKPNRTADDWKFTPRYENIALPDELRGNIKDYRENIYNSPIKTSAGKTHFGSNASTDTADRYFGHTRIEDMADNKTRRVIEVQSDLYQKGNLEGEEGFKAIELGKQLTKEDKEILTKVAREAKTMREFFDNVPGDTFTGLRKLPQVSDEAIYNFAKEGFPEKASIQKLAQYNDPTAHFRMIREEIKKASQDGKTKLQFPTGETAMKIEGLGQGQAEIFNQIGRDGRSLRVLTPDVLKVGGEIEGNGGRWIITDVLGDGKFKAVPKSEYVEIIGKNKKPNGERYIQSVIDRFERNKETFDISGKVDTNNPIYKFYEKDLGKYLTSKYNAKLITDNKGVKWYQVDITPEMKQGVDAFGRAQLGAVTKIGIGTGVASVLANGYKKLQDKNTIVYNAEDYKNKNSTNPTEKIITSPSGNFDYLTQTLTPSQHKIYDEQKYIPVDSGVYISDGVLGEDNRKSNVKITKSDFEETYKKYPELPKGILEAILMKESDMGQNTNKNDGYYFQLGDVREGLKWLAGIDGDNSKLGDVTTVRGVLDIVAKILKQKDKKINASYTGNKIKEVYDLYNGKNGADLDRFLQLFNIYKKTYE